MGLEQVADRFDQAVIERIEPGPQRRRRPMGQRCPRLYHRDRIYIHADDRRAKADGLMERRAPAHHRIEDDLARQPPRSIVRARGLVFHQTLENKPECAAAPAAPPFVQIGVRPVVVLVIRLVAG